MKTPDEKLTLKLKRDSIRRAKVEAKKRGTSVSRMVEEYFDRISPPVPLASELNISANLRSLIGIIKVPKDFDWKKEYQDHIIEKYSR